MGVFLSAPGRGTPTSLLRLERLFGLSFRTVVVVTVRVRSRPRMPLAERVSALRLDAHTVRVEVSTGFMQTTDLPTLLGPAFKSLGIASDEVAYVTGRDRVQVSARWRLREALGRSLDLLFVLLTRNAQRSVDRYNLPPKRTAEIGSVRLLKGSGEAAAAAAAAARPERKEHPRRA